MGLQEEFDEYRGYFEKTKPLPENMTTKDKLYLLGLFKQATDGPVNTSRPGVLKIGERIKWDAWKAAEGKTKEEAMSGYVTKMKQVLEEAGTST